ncbi:MAG: glycosyltransferase family 2 protein [Prevotellaceae bacterium]|nr:glycosyltransferase family 2 protein [Prevotellaceae bacterium]MDO4931246.1 glycosyltransferase family 2 protein [Prevotellaceae bacterium]
MQDFGLVSIITPTYNCARFIAETIKSVQAQTYQNWEMIIVDDFSTDDTTNVVTPYLKTDNRIIYHRLNTNSGAAIARNTALRMARGRWIAFLDSDDLWLPEKLERQITFMKENNYHFTYHEYEEIDECSIPLNIYVSGIKKAGRVAMYCCCWPGCLTVMYDREYIGLIQIANIKKNNDTAMWLQVAKKAPCYLLHERLALYRRRKGSITPQGIFGKIKAHYPLFRYGAALNPIMAWILTIANIPANIYKKIFYIKK